MAQFDNNLLNMLTKSALTPPADPSQMAAGGAGAPPTDPNAAAMASTPGGMATMPGMPPSQIPPMDPAAAGGGMGMPMDPSMMGGGMPMGAGDPNMAAAMGGGQPGAAGAPGAPGAGGKMKPEQMMQVISLRLFNIEQQLATVLREKGQSLDPGAMIQPGEATVAGAPKSPDDPAMQGAGEQQKAASELYRLHEVRATLQNQAPPEYDVWLVRRVEDPMKAAEASMQSIYDNYLSPTAEIPQDQIEGEEISLMEFGAKAAADFMQQNPIEKVADNGQVADEFAGTILGLPAISPHAPPPASRQSAVTLLSTLGIKL